MKIRTGHYATLRFCKVDIFYIKTTIPILRQESEYKFLSKIQQKILFWNFWNSDATMSEYAVWYFFEFFFFRKNRGLRVILECGNAAVFYCYNKRSSHALNLLVAISIWLIAGALLAWNSVVKICDFYNFLLHRWQMRNSMQTEYWLPIKWKSRIPRRLHGAFFFGT